MATLSLGVFPAAALGLVLGVGCLGAESMAESSSTVIDHAIVQPDARGNLMWKMSVAALATANTLDAASSWGKCEQNSVLAGEDGRFGAKGAFLKAGLAGGLVAAEWLITRKTNRYRKAFSILNFGSAVGIGAMAVRNYGIQSPPETGRCR